MIFKRCSKKRPKVFEGCVGCVQVYSSGIWIFTVEKERVAMEIQTPHHHSRINLAELKAQILKKLGPEGSKQYFYFLNKFLSLKMSKVEFNKLCLRIIGRENLPLHNQLIRSLLRNACSTKSPPPAKPKDDALKHGIQLGGKDITADGYYKNGSHANVGQASGSPGLSNGGSMLPMLPLSPRKARTGIRDRKTGNHPSALRPNGKASFAAQQTTTAQSSDFNVVLDNGDRNACDTGRPLQHHHGLMQQPVNRNEILVSNAAKMSTVSDPSCSTELVVRDDGKEASARSPLRAPLGVPLCPVSIGGACRALPLSRCSGFISTFKDGALLDSLTLRERMQHIALLQGVEWVSADAANILNHGLDAYLKGLIRSCIDLIGSKSGHEVENYTNKHPGHLKLVNDVKPSHQFQTQPSGKTVEVQEKRNHYPFSLEDFRIAMELNPRKLGEDWPLLLEKICTQAFEE